MPEPIESAWAPVQAQGAFVKRGAAVITSMASTVYPAKGMARFWRFYKHVVGLTRGRADGEQWVESDVGGSTVAVTATDTGHPPGATGAAVAFETADPDALGDALRKQSVPFVAETGATPVCRMAAIEDPDRNHVTIHHRYSI